MFSNPEVSEYETTTRRVQASCRNNTMIVWRLVRTDWYSYEEFGTVWDYVLADALRLAE